MNLLTESHTKIVTENLVSNSPTESHTKIVTENLVSNSPTELSQKQMTYPNIEILSGPCLTKPLDPPITFPFECDDFQNHAFNSTEKGNDVFISVPTSGGKTTVAEYAIMYTIKKLKKKVIYTSPIKSLSNEKYNEFKSKFSEFGVSVGLLTGDNKIDVDSDCLIMTAEILRNSLYQLKEKLQTDSEYDKSRQIDDEFIKLIGCVIMEEIHFMNDIERGRVWE